MRLLVVRCLARVVVQPETMARGNAGVNAGRWVAGSVLIEYSRARAGGRTRLRG